MVENYLPIGTVVTLKGQKKPVVIVGFGVIKDKEYFDYCAYPYPEGYCGEDKNIVFERTMIEKIEHMGFDTISQRTVGSLVRDVMIKYNEEI